MRTRVRIDLNVRVRGNGTYVGFEDVYGPVAVGDLVHVFEPESHLEGEGRITEIDPAAQIVYLTVDWGSLCDRAIQLDESSESGLLRYTTSFCRSSQLVVAGRSCVRLQTQLVQASAVPSSA